MTSGDTKPITDVRLGSCKEYDNAVGDTWDPAWADDDCLYFPGNDGSGWDKACRSNLFFNRATGADYLALSGRTVNGMPEYGGWAQAGFDECTWKSAGCISIGGTLYLSVARHRYGRLPGDPHARQIADRASIIRSTDRGATWIRPEPENHENAMFRSRRFATPYFIHYGKDNTAPDVDNARRFVYATSNNGFWCNGDEYILGRVDRNAIARLQASDWEYYIGGDGADDSGWARDPALAVPIISSPLHCGETGATYIPSAERYVMIAWYYPGDPNVETDRTHFVVYESPRPWGPWTPFAETVNWPHGWYCPRVLSKWQVRQGNEVSAVIVASGDYWQAEHYRFVVVPATFKMDGRYPEAEPGPAPVVVNDSEAGAGLNQFDYHGSWAHERARFRAYRNDEHHSDCAGDSFTFSFRGTGIRWYGSRQESTGIAAVSVDHGPERNVDLHTYSPSTQFGSLLFESGILPPGTHTLRVRVTGTMSEHAKGSRVFNDRVEILT